MGDGERSDSTEPTAEPGEPDASRVVSLARLTAALGVAASVQDVAAILTMRAAQVLEADAAMLALREGPAHLRTVAAQGLSEEQRSRLDTFEVAGPGLFSEAVRTGAMVTVHGRAEVVARYPHLDNGTEFSSVVLPLLIGPGDALGVVGFRFDGRVDPLTPDELSVLQVVADMCAQTLARLHAQADSADRAARLRFLADASQVLATSLDYRQTLSQVAALAVPTHADWCAVDIVEDGVLRTLAVAHADPEKVALAHELQARWPADPHAPGGAAQVARTGESLLIEEVTDEMLVAAARDPEHLRVARELGLRSAISVPLMAHEQVLGVLTFLAAESGRRYSETDVPFAEDLGRRAALAIDNADLFSQTEKVAAELQASLLPQELPCLPGWRLGAVYRQSGRTDVGGDFYDVVRLGGGRVAVVIGDVMGRGVDAAVAGSRMRAAVRVLIAQDPRPGALAQAMDRLMVAEALTPLATAAYLLFDPAADDLELVVAGHLPPLLLAADGTSRFVTDAGSPVLGVGTVARPSAGVTFRGGDAMLLYTDGLVERRGEGIDQGLARLKAAAADLSDVVDDGALADHDALTARLTTIVDQVADRERHDDIAVLVLQRIA